MTSTHGRQHRSILVRIPRRVMLERGLRPDFSLHTSPSSTESAGPQHDLKNRRVISETFSGAPSTTMPRAIWTSLPLPKPCPEGLKKSLSPLPMWTLSSRRRQHLTIIPGKTPPRYTPLPRYFRCCPRNSRPILPLSTMNQTALPSLSKWSSLGMDRFSVRTSYVADYGKSGLAGD
jgi:hypothetical protein